MQSITLISGKQIPAEMVVFDERQYHFFYQGSDITNDIYRRDKIALVPGFDIERDNYRVSAEKGSGVRYGNEPLNDSTLDAFGNQILNDPLGAPLETLDAGVKKIMASSGIKTILFAGVAVVALVVFIKTK